MAKKRWLFRYLGVFLLLSLGATATILSPMVSLGSDSGEEATVFSLDVDNKPLREVLKEIEKSTSYKISTEQQWLDLPMTAKLQNVGVEEGLRRLLKGFNHALIVIDQEKRIFIDIRGPSVDKKPLAGGKNSQQIDSLDREVIPPKNPGEKGVTLREIQAIRSRHKETNPLDREVFPPKAPGQRGMTVRELKALEAQQKSESSVFPFPTSPPVSGQKEDLQDGGE